MTRYLTTFIIFILIASTLVSGQIFIVNSCTSVSQIIENAAVETEKENFNSAKKALNTAIKKLEKDEKIHFILSDHELCDEIKAYLKVAEYFAAQNEKSLAGAYIALARDSTERLMDSEKFGIGNIL